MLSVVEGRSKDLEFDESYKKVIKEYKTVTFENKNHHGMKGIKKGNAEKQSKGAHDTGNERTGNKE